jgi:hypothetical protein
MEVMDSAGGLMATAGACALFAQKWASWGLGGPGGARTGSLPGTSTTMVYPGVGSLSLAIQFNTRDALGTTTPLGTFWTDLGNLLKSFTWNTPQCQAQVGPLTSGSYASSTASGLDGNMQSVSTGGCGGIPASPEHVIIVDIGAAAAAAGGTVNFNTCLSTSWDTVLYVGSSSSSMCPARGAWLCSGMNDNACGSQSSVTVNVNARFYFVVVAGKTKDAFGSYLLRWSYTSPPTKTRTPTRSRSYTSSPSKTQTPSRTRT